MWVRSAARTACAASLLVVACGNSSKDNGKPAGTAGMNEAGAGDTSATGGTSGTAGGGGSTAAGTGGTGGSAGTSGMNHGGSGGSAGLASSAGAGGRAGAAGASGAAGAGVCDHTLDNQACWSSVSAYDLIRDQPGFYGAIFDGQHIVFPNGTTAYHDYHLQLDTQGDFMHAWKSFNTNPDIGNGYRGGTFDGRYVYLTPTQPETNGTAGLTFDCVAARYDTHASFDSDSAWSSFNLTQKSGTPDLTVPGYRGAAFDGQYVYFAPSYTGDGASGNATRYDTTAPFDDKASWTDFDLSTVDPNAVSFDGAVLAGKYLYFVPGSTDSLAARYDTTAAFDDKKSWSTFDTKTVDPNAWLFNGGVFDGRYVYFVPNNQNTDKGVITRYDTQAPFEDASSWAVYNPIGTSFTDSDSFGGGAYDGRYVYFVPTAASSLVRYDPKLPFDSPDAWTKHRFTAETTGAAFDGRYLYVVPQGFGNIQRFEARAADDLGPTQASFY